MRTEGTAILFTTGKLDGKKPAKVVKAKEKIEVAGKVATPKPPSPPKPKKKAGKKK